MLKLPYTDIIDLKSNYNGAEYRLFVRFPNEYKTQDKHYPTLFALDPQYLFSICYDINMICQNYIIIGVGHKNLDFQELDNATRDRRYSMYRARDFLPWKLDRKIFLLNDVNEEFIAENIKTSGQAEKFAQFLSHQVVPLIDNGYRTTRDRTLIGHSYGDVKRSAKLIHRRKRKLIQFCAKMASYLFNQIMRPINVNIRGNHGNQDTKKTRI